MDFIYCKDGEMATIGDLIEVDTGTQYIGILVRVCDGYFTIRCEDGIHHEFYTTKQYPVFARLVRKKPDHYDRIAKEILVDMVDGSSDDSLHNLAKKLLFKNGSELKFEYVDISQPKMSVETFQKLLDELDGNSLQTLKEKNARYSIDGDALHNFRSGAEVAGGTLAQACWGYMTKHLVALRDMVDKDDFSNRDDFLEKCQDTINYIRFLWCIGNENNQNKKESN